MASVANENVTCRPASLDLLPHAPASHVRVFVPSPRLGELIREKNNETTLYGDPLTLSVSTTTTKRAKTVRETWPEPVHDRVTNGARYEAQMRAWRRDTPDDARATFLWRAENARDKS